jgi:hypothetical protein
MNENNKSIAKAIFIVLCAILLSLYNILLNPTSQRDRARTKESQKSLNPALPDLSKCTHFEIIYPSAFSSFVRYYIMDINPSNILSNTEQDYLK